MPSDTLEILSETERCLPWAVGLQTSRIVQWNKSNNFADHIECLVFFCDCVSGRYLRGCQSIPLFWYLGVFLPARPGHQTPLCSLTNATDVTTGHILCPHLVSGRTAHLHPRWPGTMHAMAPGRGRCRVHLVHPGLRRCLNVWLFFPPLLGAKVTELSFTLCSVYAGCTNALTCCWMKGVLWM